MAYCLLLCNEITVITKYTKSAAVNASGWTHTMLFWEANLVLIFYCTNHYLVNRYICCFFSLIYLYSLQVLMETTLLLSWPNTSITSMTLHFHAWPSSCSNDWLQ